MRRSSPGAAWLIWCVLLGGCGGCRQENTAPPGSQTGRITARVEAIATPAAHIAMPTAGRAAVAPSAPGAGAEPDAGTAPQDEGPTGAEIVAPGDCVVIIDADPDVGEPPLAVSFSVESQCTSGTPTYTWDFGDGSPPSSEPAPVHIYQKVGEYTVTLKAVAPDGTPASDDIGITVEEAMPQ